MAINRDYPKDFLEEAEKEKKELAECYEEALKDRQKNADQKNGSKATANGRKINNVRCSRIK